MSRGFGFDFGTTNCAAAVAETSAETSAVMDAVRVAHFATSAGSSPSFRSVLFFGQEDDGPVETAAGARAIERYLEYDERRRLMQSLKSFLASRSFKATRVFDRTMTLEDLIAHIIEPLREEAEAQLGRIRPPAVVGRPVRFVNAREPEDEQRALTRLQAAMWQAGFPDVTFEYEPVAAAYHYEQELDHDELVMVADFGGGTSDFCLIRVGPGLLGRPRAASDIIGSAGVGIAGDAFDAKIVRELIAPRLGRGSLRQVFLGKAVPMPNWIYRDLERWHHLSFLRSHKTLGFLYEALEGAEAPEQIEALIHVVENDLGYPLYRAVQRTKQALSVGRQTRFEFEDAPVRIEATVTRDAFESWIAEELDAIARCVDDLLDESAVAIEEVDRVFMTGGSAFVPAARKIFADRFGEARLTGGGELISVARGLALRASDLARAAQ
jgi:hypothetical chaperone protein